MSRRVKMCKDTRNQGRPWVVRWSNGTDLVTGKAKWFAKSFKYKVKARDFAAQKRAEPPDIAQAVEPPRGMTLGEFLRDWSGTRNNNDYRTGTRTLDGNTITRLIGHFGKETLLTDITPMEAAKFIATLTRIDGKDKPLSPWSRARTLRNVKTMFNVAAEWELIDKNPFGKIGRPKLPDSRWHYLMPDEFHALLTATNGKNSVPLRCKVLYALLYCCGLRLGEALNLRWDQNIKFIFDKGTEQVIEGTVCIDNRPATTTEPPFYVKDKESRKISIPRRCLDLLIDSKTYNEVTDQSPYVVLDQGQYQTMTAKWRQRRKSKKPWENRDMQNNTLAKFKRHVRWAKIRPEGSLSLHTLRKTCITNWANEINNPEVVRQLAGHADIKTTMQFYCTVTAEQRRKAAQAIDQLLTAGLAADNWYV